MSTTTFQAASREHTSMLAAAEKRTLIWIAERLPEWVNSDHLTALGFVALLAAQPTRGVDVGAIEFIHGELRKARAAGKAVLLVSAELREVLSLADRIAVMYGGKIVTVLDRADASEEVLGPFMTGARREVAA